MEQQLDLDIRPALRARLKSIDDTLSGLKRETDKYTALRNSVAATLSHEEAIHGNDSDEAAVPALHPTGSGMGLADLLLRLLETGPQSLDQLKDAGGGWPLLQGHASPGRAINFALVGMQKGKHVRRRGDGKWELVSGQTGK